MNRELLSELYQEAVKVCVDVGPNPDGTNKAWLWEEAFAELIVRECIKSINLWSEEVPGSEGYDIFAISKLKSLWGIE